MTQFLAVWIRRRIFCVLKPFLEYVHYLHFPFTHKKVTGEHYYDLIPKLKPGTLFTTHISGEATNYLIPGHWTHVAIYTPDPTKKVSELVTQAEGEGVGTIDLISFMVSKDEIRAFEPNLPSPLKEKVMARAAEIAAAQVGDKYDYGFGDWRDNNKDFYCSKLGWYAFDVSCQEHGIPSLFRPKRTLGVPTVTPEEVAVGDEDFTMFWNSLNLKK